MTATTLNGTAPAPARSTLVDVVPAATARPIERIRREAADLEAQRWKRLRWGVRIALVLGVAASVAANMLHARPNPISQAIAAWPPFALLVTVELISRVPVYRLALAWVRFIATAVISGIAAWVSYWHMVGVTARYGETGASPYLLPLSVDGLVVVASVCLVEISGRIHHNEPEPIAPPLKPGEPPAFTSAPPVPQPTAETASLEAPGPTATVPDRGRPPILPPVEGRDTTADTTATPPSAETEPGAAASPAPAADLPDEGDIAVESAASPTADPVAADDRAAGPEGSDAPPGDSGGSPPDDDESDVVPKETAAAVAYWLRRDPQMHPDVIAERVGKSSRQVRRYMSPAATPAGTGDRRRVNGRPTSHGRQ